ncbi:MAG: nucleotidyl transferase AbiEii/AbiGii toxin family protein [Sandaracinaceae bacterium]|nr:nucleotidyl transferase AbiEii/AbiGii toxin family protein [Sandaracinaceae bacterium]
MTRRRDRGSAASVRARLRTLSSERGEEYQRLLIRFGIERLLYRLSKSEHAASFVLKGATLFAVWTGTPHRATKDLDLLGFGSPDPDRLVDVFKAVVDVPVAADGVVFDAESIKATEIGAGKEYDGIRLTMEARLGTARIPVQVDVGFGDATAIPPAAVEVPTLLPDQPAPNLRAYSREVVVAEKFHAIVLFGTPNTRMKDYYDLVVLAQRFDFDGVALGEAIAATFERRKTALPTECPEGLHDDFGADPMKTKQWRAFLRRSGAETLELTDAVRVARAFLLPVALGVARAESPGAWKAGGPWA